jgi:prepilin-type N-terminal cleavage/methylation domain-containing protein
MTMSQPKRWPIGFTLVELVITVALLAIVVSITIPRLNYGAVRTAEVKTTAQAFAGMLRVARSLAVSDAGGNSQGYQVVIEAGAYSLINADTVTTVKGPVTIPDGISTSGDTEIQFNRLGEMSGGAGKSVTFSSGSTSVTITVTPVGGVKMSE